MKNTKLSSHSCSKSSLKTSPTNVIAKFQIWNKAVECSIPAGATNADSESALLTSLSSMGLNTRSVPLQHSGMEFKQLSLF